MSPPSLSRESADPDHVEERIERNRRRRRFLFAARVVGFFVVFHFYVLLRIRPELFYHQNPLVFLFDARFFAGFLGQPGGLVEYASAFLSPLFADRWLGALTLTLLAALICLATRRFFAAVAGDGGQVVFLMPAVLILTVLGQYIHPVRLCVGLSVALVFANVYVRAEGGRVVVRLAVFLVASAVVYYMAAGLYAVFACLCGVFEWRVKRSRLLDAWYVLCAASVPIAARAWLFDVSVDDAYRGLMLPREGHWLGVPSSVPFGIAIHTALLLFLPAAAMALAWRRRPAVSTVVGAEGELSPEASCGANGPISAVRLALPSALLLVLILGADVVSFDFPKKCLLEIAYGAEQGRWTDVLAHARRLPPSDARSCDPRVACHVNRALYSGGDLLDRMFSYPQALDTPSLTLAYQSATTMAKLTPRQSSAVLFDLGRVNESEHMAYEALETFGERPRILKRLVYLSVLKGEPEAARRFLALLECSLLYRQWARRLLGQLDADPTLSGVPAVALRRELMVTRDSTDEVARLESMLQGLLDRNRRNRMAFEYLMAHYLLTRQLDKLAANLHRLDDFDYPRVPRHCEEALVIYLTSTGSRDLDLGKREISPETWRRFGEFVRTEQQFREDPPAAFDALAPDFGDSYFFSYVFGHNNLQNGPSRPSE